jgi:predicted transcriptional regulator
MIRCPVCGTRLAIAKQDVVLTTRQRQVRDAVAYLRRQSVKPTCRNIGVHIGINYRTVASELQVLEQLELVCRPDGPRSGYALPREEIALVIAA